MLMDDGHKKIKRAKNRIHWKTRPTTTTENVNQHGSGGMGANSNGQKFSFQTTTKTINKMADKKKSLNVANVWNCVSVSVCAVCVSKTSDNKYSCAPSFCHLRTCEMHKFHDLLVIWGKKQNAHPKEGKIKFMNTHKCLDADCMNRAYGV